MCKILPTILIVDDNANLRIALADIFLQFGHDVRTAADGFEALSAIRKKVPTVLISDLDMPGMSGFELLSVVRRRFPSVRVVAMSGAYSGTAVPTGIAADAFYAKGCGNLLFKLVDKVVDLSVPVRADHTPVWIPVPAGDWRGQNDIAIPCSECLRVSSHNLRIPITTVSTVICPHCSTKLLVALAPIYSAHIPAYIWDERR
jgi:CheY-like chemotaxis protein